VFYELGYADGLGKKVVVTAKDGTEPPFDISDVPTALPKATPPLGPR
jgi:nucleoside 2-deoxyribosyltransferase